VAKRMGFNLGQFKNESEIFDEIALVTPILAGISHERLEKQGIQWPCPTKDHPGTPTLFIERFNTPTGKAKLFPVEYVEQTEKVDEEFPFILNTGRILYQYHTTTMSARNKSLNAFANKSYVLMNAVNAGKLNLQNGDKVKVISRRGEVQTTLKISDEVLQNELFIPFHYSETPVNKLTRSELDPYSKIPPFKLSACRVEKTE